MLLPWGLFIAPLGYVVLYSPSKRHMPRSFFNDGSEQYVFWAENVHKSVRADEITLFGWFAAFFEQR
jgi:hypothetical protein